MNRIRTIYSAVLILATQVPSSAQQTDAIINFGVLRVAACAASADAGYGLTAARPIQLGGGPAYADSRMNRFIGALRGPNGETLRIASRGSGPAPAFPLPCGDRTLTPQRVEISGPQGLVAQNGGLIKDEALAKMFPGMKLPAESVGVRFRQSQVSGIKIIYSEACNATPAEVPLLVRLDNPRSPLRPLPLPPGVVEAEPAIFLQVIVDPLGQFAGAVYIGGPKSLLPAALEAVGKMRTDPIRLNGVGIDNPTVIPLVFQ